MPLTGYLEIPEIDGESRVSKETADEFEFEFTETLSKTVSIEELIDAGLISKDDLYAQEEREKMEYYSEKEEMMETEAMTLEYFDFI